MHQRVMLVLATAALFLASSAECRRRINIVGHHPEAKHEQHIQRKPGSDGCGTDAYVQLWKASPGSEQLASLVACVPRGVGDACDAHYGAGNYAVLRVGGAGDGGQQAGCLKFVQDGINQVCPRDFPFAWYAAPSEGNQPYLKECWADNGGHGSCETAPFTSSSSIAALAADITLVNTTSLAGCTPAVGTGNIHMLCPSAFPFFAATAAGALPSPTSRQSSCAYTAPVCQKLNKVPVIDSSIADVSGVVLGCLGTDRQLDMGEACPDKVPHPAARVANYSFFVAPGANNNGLLASRVSECRRKDGSSSCGESLLPARRHWIHNSPDGCLSKHAVVCSASSIGGVRYEFPLLGPEKPGVSAAPVLEQCSTAPPSCDGVAGAEYVVPVTNGGLNDKPAPMTIMACQTANTACPSLTHFPRINKNGTVYACRSVQTLCPPGHTTLCRDGTVPGRTNADGGCPPPNIMGCVDPGASLQTACYHPSKSGYPTTRGYPVFVASLSPPAYYNLVVACYSSLVHSCGPPLEGLDVVRVKDASYSNPAWAGQDFAGKHSSLVAMMLSRLSCRPHDWCST